MANSAPYNPVIILTKNATNIMIKSLVPTTIALFAGFSLSAQTFNTPVEYIQFFNEEFVNMQQLQVEYASLLIHEDEALAEETRLKLQQSVDAALNKFGGVTPHPDDKGLKQSAVDVLKTLERISDNNHKEAIAAKVGCTDCFEAIEMEYQLGEKDGAEVHKSMENMRAQIAKFAKDHNITLKEGNNSYNSVIERINRVTSYSQAVNLGVLQVQYADDLVISAINEKRLDDAKTAVKALAQATNEATARLKKIQPIAEDKTCITQAENYILFYQKAAKEHYPDMLSAFDKNGEVINEKVDVYNKNIDLINTQGNGALDRYLQAKDALLKRAIPKPEENGGKRS